MLASRLPGILPQLTEQAALETAAVASISAHGFDASCWGQPPFRNPHHTASAPALVGGGSDISRRIRENPEVSANITEKIQNNVKRRCDHTRFSS